MRQYAGKFPGAGQSERLPTGHEDVLTAVVVERFPGESAIESFEAQARDVEEPQPFVLSCPPERTGSTIVQGVRLGQCWRMSLDAKVLPPYDSRRRARAPLRLRRLDPSRDGAPRGCARTF